MVSKGITVKYRRATLGQKRVLYRALHEADHNLHCGRKVLIAVVMTMTQESGCRSLNYGDRDSVGPFQQRDSWGSTSTRKNAADSARLFILGGHGGEPGWKDYFPLRDLPDDFNLDEAIQRVQVSADPWAYGQWESEASRTVAKWFALNKR